MRIQDSKQAVRNWIWQEGVFRPDLGDTTPLGDTPLESLSGQFAIHEEPRPGDHLLVRDRLGVNKLFFALDEAGRVHSSNFLIELRRAGFPLAAIHSVPSGHSIRLSPASGRYELAPHATLPFAKGDLDPGDGLRVHANEIRRALDDVFERLASALRGRRIFLTLSGGLDSTTIAALAARHLEKVTAVTFELERADGSAATVEDPAGDLASARKVAAFLDLPHEVIRVSAEALLELLDPVLLWGQDWRDFNVHCGLVNAALARGLNDRGARSGANERPVFLTGDTMNELMADYHAESYAGEEHYALPRLGLARLRKSLVEGLDSGDREIGIFSHYGFDAIQPYAICAETYTSIPAEALASDHVKQELVREVMGESIPAHVYSRPKVRAQVASADGVGGTLAALVDRGVNSDQLKTRFADLFGGDVRDLGGLIRAGFYRMSADLPIPSPRQTATAAHQEPA